MGCRRKVLNNIWVRDCSTSAGGMSMRYVTVLLSISALLVFSAKAQTEKRDFTGSWQMHPGQTLFSNGGAFLLWMKVEQKDAAIHVTRGWKGAYGNEVVTEVRCKTNG